VLMKMSMMRVLIILLVLLGNAFAAFCQADTVGHHVDTITNPESVYNSELPHDLKPYKDSVRLAPNEIPKKLLHRLTHNKRYDGWEENGVYLDKNTGVYMLYIASDSLMIKYGLDEYGKVVTYTSFVKR